MGVADPGQLGEFVTEPFSHSRREPAIIGQLLVLTREKSLVKRTRAARRWGAIAVALSVVLSVGVVATPASAAPTATITGRVYLDSTWTPAPAGDVLVEFTRSGSEHQAADFVPIDSAGQFTITGLEAGSYTLFYNYVGSSGYADSWQGRTANQDGPGNLVSTSASSPGSATFMVLQKFGKISGEVTLGADEVLPGSGEVVLYYKPHRDGSIQPPFQSITVGDDGHYETPQLAPGRYWIKFTYSGGLSVHHQWPSAIGTSGVMPVTVAGDVAFPSQIPSLETISGTITLGPSGQLPLAGDVTVTAMSGSNQYNAVEIPDVAPVVVDAAGGYRLTDVPSISVVLRLDYTGEGYFQRQYIPQGRILMYPFDAVENRFNAVIPTAATLGGQVFFDSPLDPVGAGEARITISNYGGEVVTLLTDAEGRWEARYIQPGSYRIAIVDLVGDRGTKFYPHDRATYAADYIPVGISSSQPNLDVVLGADGEVNGVVAQKVPVDLRLTGVFVDGPHRGEYVEWETTADHMGYFHFKSIPEDLVFFLEAFPGDPAYAAQSWAGWSNYYAPTPFLISSGYITVTLQRAGTISGAVSGEVIENVGGAGASAEILVYDDYGRTWVRTGDEYPVAADGTYVIPSLAPGQYRVRFSQTSDGRPVNGTSRVVSVTADAVTTVNGILNEPSMKTEFTGDGLPDLLARGTTGELWLLRGNGASGWSKQTAIGRGWTKVNLVITTGDFDGDGFADIMVRRVNGELVLFRGNGAGGWRGSRSLGAGWGSYTAIIGPGDLNGDGFADLLVRNTKGELHLRRGDGAGGWLGSTRLSTGWNSYTAIAAAGDFDGDGYPDVVARKANGALVLFSGNGTGGLLAPRQIGIGWNAYTSISGGSDYTGDGNVDVVVRTAKGALMIFEGDGMGGWQGSRTLSAGWSRLSVVG